MNYKRKSNWIEKGINEDKTHNIICKFCGSGYRSRGHAQSAYTTDKYHYCPKCGKDMTGSEDDMVTITCYGNTETRDRKDAIKFYSECAENSDGCEKMRYTNILVGLYAGLSEVDDNEGY